MLVLFTTFYDYNKFNTTGIFNLGKDSKYDVTSENWEVGFALLYQPFVDSQNGVVETFVQLL